MAFNIREIFTVLDAHHVDYVVVHHSKEELNVAINDAPSLEFDFARAEHEQLRAWIATSTDDKIAFFEEMVELAYQSGALAPDRLALRNSRT